MAGRHMREKFWLTLCTIAIALFLVLNLSGCTSGNNEEVLTEDIPEAQESIISMDDDSASTGNSSTINVPEESDTDSMISINVENMGRTNPFVPPNGLTSTQIAGIPKESLKYELLPPIEVPSEDKAAKTVVTTKVSGIMYDKISPSAILNIDGLDYLVRSGDVLNGYKVLSIEKSVVTVQMGANIYKAGVGELLADGKNGIKYNQVANLSNKFGGSKK